MVNSLTSLVSNLHAQSKLANIMVSLLNPNSWLTRRWSEVFDLVLENKDKYLSDENVQDSIFAEYKREDVKEYMMLAYGLYYIQDREFVERLKAVLPEFILGDLIEIDWSGIEPSQFLASFDTLDTIHQVSKRFDSCLRGSCYEPFSVSLVYDNLTSFTSDPETYFLKAIESFLRFNKCNIRFGESDCQWKLVEGQTFNAIYLDCTQRNDSIISDIESSLNHLKEDGRVILRTRFNKEKSEKLHQYLIDEDLLESVDFTGGLFREYLLCKSPSRTDLRIYTDSHLAYSTSSIKETIIDKHLLKEKGYYDLNPLHLDCLFNYEEKGEKISTLLKPVSVVEHMDEVGKIFKFKNFPTDFKSFELSPEDLDSGNVKNYRKVTEAVLVLSKDFVNQRLAYINASQTVPVYIPNQYLIFKIDEGKIQPLYFFYLYQTLIWSSLMKNFNQVIFPIQEYMNPDYSTIRISEEEAYLSAFSSLIPLPSLSMQQQQIDTSIKMKAVLDLKEKEWDDSLNRKDWLNEQHIREVKHQLANALLPLNQNVDLILNLMKIRGSLSLEDIVSQKRNISVGDILSSMEQDVRNVSLKLDNLTSIKSYSTDISEIEVGRFLGAYCKKLSSLHPMIHFKFSPVLTEAFIRISESALKEMLDNIVQNAFRHGFQHGKQADMVISFSVEVTDNGQCKICVANNGTPMCQRAKDIYRIKGQIAGPTGNTGIGGAVIARVCDLFKGKLSFDQSPEYPVIIVTEFPILNL